MGGHNSQDRREVERDHDVLTRIDANLSNHMRRMEEHVDDDEKKFHALGRDVGELKRYLWMCLGIVSFIIFITKIKFG